MTIATALLLAAAPTAAQDRSRIGPLPFFPVTVAWDTGLGAAPAARPAAADGMAFVPLRDGSLVQLRLDSGQVGWRIPVATTAPPAADGRHVYVHAEASLTAFSRETGEARWHLGLETAPTAPMVARGGWLFVARDEGQLMAIDAETGRIVWQHEFGARINVPVAVDGDRLAIGLSDGRVSLIDLLTGTPQWQQRLGGAVTGVQLDAERVYAGSRDRFFYALSAANGRMAWRWRTGGDVVGQALLDDRHVYVVSLDNLVRALDRRNGAQRWHKPVRSRALGGPVRAGDAIILAGLSPEVHGYAWRDGAPLGPFRTGAEIAAPPLILEQPLARGGDLLVVFQVDGRVVAARRRVEPPTVPLSVVPGVPVPLSSPPVVPEPP